MCTSGTARGGISSGRLPSSSAARMYSCVASLMDSIVSRRNSWSPQSIRLSMYLITTVFWYAVVRARAMRCGLERVLAPLLTLVTISSSSS